MYPDGSWFQMFFDEFPNVIVRISAKGVMASGDSFIVAIGDPRPDEDFLGKLWDALHAIPDLM